MSEMMALAEIRRWECPCDENFWTAPTAKSWENTLGSVSEPLCPIYGQMAASLLPTTASAFEPIRDRFLPRTNSWTAKLLLMAIIGEVFHYEHKAAVIRMSTEEPIDWSPEHSA